MPRSPEQSDPEIEITVEDAPEDMETSGMRRVRRTLRDPGERRFTVPPPASYIAKKPISLSAELDPVDEGFDLPIPTVPSDLLEDSGDQFHHPTTPPSAESTELLQSETRLRVAHALSTPPVQNIPNKYDVPEFPLTPWETAVENSVRLFLKLHIDVQPLIDYFRQNIESSQDLDYRHEVILTTMVLRDATAMMQAYFMEGSRPNPHDPLGEFFWKS